MILTATILPFSPAPAVKKAPVKVMLSPEEENLVALVANIIVDQTIQEVYEESNQIPEVQPERPE